MVQLVGTVELEDGLRVSAPGMSGEAVLLDAGAGAARDGGTTLPAGCLAFAALEQALAAACADVRTVEITPRSVRPLGHPLAGAAADAFVQLEVTTPPGQGAVVLVQDEAGALAWHAPRPLGGRPADVLVFQIPVPAGGSALMGAGGWLTKLFKVAFFDLATVSLGRVGAFLVSRWEEEARPTRLRWFTPDSYDRPCVPDDLIGRQDGRALGGGRVLVFVHGALATSHGAFGGTPRGEMARLWAHYGGRVVAFDHATLADSPRRSAERLLALLPEGLAADVDVACHGRGALVARVLAGELGPAPARLRVRRVLPAGAPDHGSLPADVDALLALLDRVTNAVAAPCTRSGSLGAPGLREDLLAGVVGAAKLVAGGVAPCSGPLPTYPAGRFVRDPGAGPGGVFYGIPSDLDVRDPALLAGVRSSIVDGSAELVFGAVPDDLVVTT